MDYQKKKKKKGESRHKITTEGCGIKLEAAKSSSTNAKTMKDILSRCPSQTQQRDTRTGRLQTMRLTFLTVVKLVELNGFGLTLAEDQVVSDIAVRVIWRFPLEDDLGGRVGRGNRVQRDGGFWGNITKIQKKKFNT